MTVYRPGYKIINVCSRLFCFVLLALFVSATSKAARQNQDDEFNKILRRAGFFTNNLTAKEKSLHSAASAGNLARVKRLVRGGVNVNAAQRSGWTGLMFAALQRRSDVVRYLLQHGAKPDLQNRDGDTALFYAARNADFKTMALLLDAGAEPNVRALGGDTIIMQIIGDGNVKEEQALAAIKFLVARGADVNIRTGLEATALSRAEYVHKSSIARLLRQHGAK